MALCGYQDLGALAWPERAPRLGNQQIVQPVEYDGERRCADDRRRGESPEALGDGQAQMQQHDTDTVHDAHGQASDQGIDQIVRASVQNVTAVLKSREADANGHNCLKHLCLVQSKHKHNK